MRFNTTRKCATEFLVLGIGLLSLSVVLIVVFPSIYKSQLAKHLELIEGTILYPLWKEIPLPIYERLYFFNITNPVEFLKYGEKLNVTQVGPYTFKGKWVKDPVAWNPNGTVSYREVRTYHFLPEKSSGSEDDVIVTLNGPMITAANVLKNFPLPIKVAASIFLGIENEKLITHHTVRELTYGGYEDPLIKYGRFLIKNLPFKNGIFSWFYGQNDTDDGMFTVFTGKDNVETLNVIDKWNGRGSLEFWNGKSCNMINGSSGEMSPPLRDDQQEYTFFQSILCRCLTFTYSGEQTHKGVKSKRFSVTDKVFANATENPENSCFQTSKVMPSGVQDISACQFGSPIFMSFPHFYLADPSYLDLIEGLRPEEQKHFSYFDIEPTSGISIDIKLRFQINLRLEKIHGLLQFQHVTEGIFPVLWADLEGTLSDSLAKYLLEQLDNPKIIFYSLVGIVLFISVIMIVVSVVVLLRLRGKPLKDDDDDKLLGEEEPTGNSKHQQVRNEPRKTDYATRGECADDSVEVSSSHEKHLTASDSFDDDAKLLDAADSHRKPGNHSQGLRAGGLR